MLANWSQEATRSSEPTAPAERRRRCSMRPKQHGSSGTSSSCAPLLPSPRSFPGPWDVVFHLAAVASGSEARSDPGLAWEVNAAGTARLAEALGAERLDGGNPLLLVVSTAEVYGPGDGSPRRETDPAKPCSPYAASKLGAEIAAFDVACRTGLRVVVVRPFPHTGPGQDLRFVVPALAERLAAARRLGAPAIKAGNVDAVRDFLDVRDVVSAYRLLAERGTPGEVYNVASGKGISIEEVREAVDGSARLAGDARAGRPPDAARRYPPSGWRQWPPQGARMAAGDRVRSNSPGSGGCPSALTFPRFS